MENSNVYKVSCYSDCGSYFGSYLQSVTVVAIDKDEALSMVEKWLKKTGKSFIYPKERTVKVFGKDTIRRWSVDLLCSNITNGMVIDTHEDSDY